MRVSRMKEQPPKLTRYELASQVAQVLRLPQWGWRGEAYKVVQVIIKVVSDALFRGEKVKIDGFGIFETYIRPPTRSPVYFYPYLKQKGLHWEVKDLPAKPRIIFKPSKALLRYINE